MSPKNVHLTRDDFPKRVREKVAARVGYRCSNPYCQKLTSGPGTDPFRSINIGVAAHISAASVGGPRYDAALPPMRRSSIDNALWLCASCASLIDRDPDRFGISLLKSWREQAESAASQAIAAGSHYRSIAAPEVLRELSIGQVVAVKALEEEFGCHVETMLHVAAGDGWLRLDAAVVRGETLVAIDIHEHHGTGIPYFQIEHFLKLCDKLKFQRFQNCLVYLVVVSDGLIEKDTEVESRLTQIAEASDVETRIRMFRLNTLRSKFGMRAT